MKEKDVDLAKFYNVLKIKWWLIILFIAAFVGPVIWYNQTTRPVFKASTTIIIEEKTNNKLAEPVGLAASAKFVNRIEEIKSRSLAIDVANALPVTIQNSFPMPEHQDANFSKELYIAGKIRKGISAELIPESDIIKIDVEGYTPIAAEILANTLTDVMLQRDLNIKKQETTNVREIIREQLDSYKAQLDDADYALKTFKERSKVTAIEQEAEEVLQRITEAENLYNKSKASLDAARRRYAVIQQKLESERKGLVPAVTEITSPWAQRLKDQLVELEVQYTTLKVQNYLENHPKMQQLRQQINATKKNLKEESLKIASGENIVDPISQIQKYMEELITLEIEIKTSESQEATLRETLDTYERKLVTLPDKELRMHQLMRDKNINEQVYTMLLQEEQQAKIAEAEISGNIRVLDPALEPNKPIRPRKILNIILSILFGLVAGTVFTFLIEYFDDSVTTIDHAEALTGLAVLGSVPKIRSKVSRSIRRVFKQKGSTISKITSRLITKYSPKSPESEAFRSLRTNLQLTDMESEHKVILLTSGNPREGKSLIAANLSLTTAQMGLKTLLIDADLRKPMQHLIFQRDLEPGMTNIIYSKNGYANEPDLANRIRNSIRSTGTSYLDIITAGFIPPNPSEMLASRITREILQKLKAHYEVIFIDSPPINIVSDAGVLGRLTDSTLLVIKSGKTTIRDLKRAQDQLKKAQNKVAGLVLNYLDGKDSNYRYYSHYHGYFRESYKDENLKKSYDKAHQLGLVI